MTFEQLGLSEELLRAVKAKGYTTPSPIQAKAIPVILEGKDILAAAQTGTGKTAGFTLPLLQNLSDDQSQKGRRKIRALIVTPTRELAAQIQESIRAYGKNLRLRSTVIFGGVPASKQISVLRQGVDILVATPGRLLDLQNQGFIDLSKVEILVMDEADRMLDMGFIHDIKKILALVPKYRQNLLFSATFSNDIRKLAKGFMNNPVSVDVAPRNTAAETVKQQVYRVDKSKKPAILTQLIKQENWEQVLVFTRTKHGANRLAQKLHRAGINSAAIHGNKSQGARTRALADFKNGRVQVLVATDIAARGLDIEQLPWVVNFELPNVAEDYVHRIGRTGRAGMSGQAVSLVSGEEQKLLSSIERLLQKRIETQVLEGFEPELNVRTNSAPKPQGYSRKEKSFPQKGRNRNNRNRNNNSGNNQNRNNQNSQDKAVETVTTEAKEQAVASASGNQRPKRQEEQGQNNNRRNNNRNKPKSKRRPNNKNRNNNKSNNSKRNKDEKKKDKLDSIPFSKAIKKRKPGKKGPVGYGMWPLE